MKGWPEETTPVERAGTATTPSGFMLGKHAVPGLERHETPVRLFSSS